MPTLLYNPGIHIAIATYNKGMIDVSNDIESGQLTVNENAPHQLQFTLSNRNNKYTQLFTPNDRVVIQMKRIRWLQVFSGYLNTVPYFSAYNRSVTLTGTCTIKRIVNHWWEPGYAPVLQFLQSWLSNQNTTPDAGMAAMIQHMLTDIIGWEEDKIHIGTIPQKWMAGLNALWSNVQAQVTQSYNSVGGLIIGGNGTVSTGSLVAPNVSGINSGTAPAGVALALNAGQPVPDSSLGSWDCAMAWPYLSDVNDPSDVQNSLAYLASGQRLLVANANTGQAICVQTQSTKQMPGMGTKAGPTGAIALSPKALQALGFTASGGNPSGNNNAVPVVDIAWAPTSPVTPLGQYSAGPANSTSGGTQIPTTTITTPTGGTEAANIAISLIGLPYKAGSQGPNAFDAPGLVYACWRDAGQTLPKTVAAMLANPGPNKQFASIPAKSLAAGDLLFANGSVAMFVGNNSVVQALPGKGKGVGIQEFSVGSAPDITGWVKSNPGYQILRVQGATSNGNLEPVSPTITFKTTVSSGLNSSPDGELIQPTWYPAAVQPDPLAAAFTGLKVLMNDTPIGNTLSSVVQAGLRSFCAAPNGDFISWFPDYFDQYGIAAKWYLSPIETQDFTISWSDQNMVTHSFTSGTPQGSYLNASLDPTDSGNQVTETNMLQSMGVATIDIKEFVQILFNLDPSVDRGVLTSAAEIYKQFGPRPLFTPMVQASQGPAEFWYAVRIFMTSWANLFSATVPMTFMPELWPGMLLVLQEYSFQAYITSVTHTWDLSEGGGGFSTSAIVVAPSDPNSHQGLIGIARSG